MLTSQRVTGRAEQHGELSTGRLDSGPVAPRGAEVPFHERHCLEETARTVTGDEQLQLRACALTDSGVAGQLALQLDEAGVAVSFLRAQPKSLPGYESCAETLPED